jgi:SH3-like domain-containing protein
VAALFLLISSVGCSRSPRKVQEVAYVSAPQANLRDRLASLYNRTGIVRNGEQVVVLEKQKRFARVRNAAGEEGWIELRYLVGQDVYDEFQNLAVGTASLPRQGIAAARATLNIHLKPSRDADHLYQLTDGEKVELIKRGVGSKEPVQPTAPPKAEKPATADPKAVPGKNVKKPAALERTAEKKPATSAPPPVLEDWWLVRDAKNHVGWVLGRMLDFQIPLEIAQYSEGERMIGCFPLNNVQDGDRQVTQFVTAITENKDGLPYDFDQIRVFTWNVKRHRYETAYRERKLFGMLPLTTGHETFGNEGVQPTFTIRIQDENAQKAEKTYRLAGPLVHRVLTDAEQAKLDAEMKAKAAAAPARSRRHRRH